MAGIAVALTLLTGSTVRVGGPCEPTRRVSLDRVDHSQWDALLARYVDERGMVDYRAWKDNPADVQALEGYLRQAGCVDLQARASRAAHLAYWINVYNALTVRGILREYPTSSIRNHTARVLGYNIWEDLLLWVDGREYSLDEIEHQVLRPMSEPRIHFAIVCAAKGCPRLRNEAYTAERLEEQLVDNARDFFAQPDKFRADLAGRTFHVSPILNWFGEDFGPNQRERLAVIAPYLPSAEARALARTGNARIRFLDYDWSLNERGAAARTPSTAR